MRKQEKIKIINKEINRLRDKIRSIELAIEVYKSLLEDLSCVSISDRYINYTPKIQ